MRPETKLFLYLSFGGFEMFLSLYNSSRQVRVLLQTHWEAYASPSAALTVPAVPTSSRAVHSTISKKRVTFYSKILKCLMKINIKKTVRSLY